MRHNVIIENLEKIKMNSAENKSVKFSFRIHFKLMPLQLMALFF